MTTVHKFVLEIGAGETAIKIHEQHGIIAVKVQHNKPVIYALVETNSPMGFLKVYQFETGVKIPEPEKKEFIGTVLMDDGDYVTHLFVDA